jgi:hypothetical protein
MLTPSNVLIHGLTVSRDFVLRFCGDLTPAEFLHRPTPKSNCAAWLVGHLTLSDRRVTANVLGDAAVPLPLPDGFEKRFSRDEGSPEADAFGDVSGLLPLFAAGRDRMIERVGTMTPAELEKPLDPPHPRFKMPWDAANFMVIHTTMHAGQITIIRRSLGRPPLF